MIGTFELESTDEMAVAYSTALSPVFVFTEGCNCQNSR